MHVHLVCGRSGFDPHVRQHSFMEIGHEIISMDILSHPLIQEEYPKWPKKCWRAVKHQHNNNEANTSLQHLSRLMTKPTKWSVHPGKTQISLDICPVWSESSLCAQCVAKVPIFLHFDIDDSDQTGRMPRLIWVFAGCICHFVGFITRRLISLTFFSSNIQGNNSNHNHNQLIHHNPIVAVFNEYNNCPQHRGIVLSLSACLQVITMSSPSALIWNNLAEGRSNSPFCGSPLDLLPCPPSTLPMPHNEQNPQVRLK